MRKSTVLVLVTKKITGVNADQTPKIETIRNKQVVGQSLNKFYQFISVQGYKSVELESVLIVTGDKSKEASKDEFNKYNDELLQILEDNKIQNGIKEEKVGELEEELNEATTKKEELEDENAELKRQIEELKKLKSADTRSKDKAVGEMTVEEIKDYITAKGYLIPLNQNKADLIAQITAHEEQS